MKKRNTADENKEKEVPREEDQEQQPGKSKRVKGQIKEYYFLKTVKSIEEMNEIRFKNFCHNTIGRRHDFKSTILPCKWKYYGKTCDFELLAERPDLKSGIIHIYGHSKHNHSIMSEEKRSASLKTDLMPAKNPPNIFRTPENIEWKFLQTFSDFDKMHKFRIENQCYQAKNTNKKWCRIRFYCKRKFSQRCKFMLLAMKTTTQGYHVYTHGQHKHNKKHLAKVSEEALDFVKNKNQGQANENHDQHNLDQQEGMALEDEEGEEHEEDEVEGEEEEEEEEEEQMEMEDDIMVSIDEEEKEVKQEGMEDGEGEEEVEEEEEGKVKNEDENLSEEESDSDEEEEEQMEMEDNIMKQEVKEEGDNEVVEENPLANPTEETLEEMLAKSNQKVYNWMAGIATNEIEQTIGDWDKTYLLKFVEMADQEIREHPEKLNLWLPWLKCAIPKCLPQIDGFLMRFNDLIQLTFN